MNNEKLSTPNRITHVKIPQKPQTVSAWVDNSIPFCPGSILLLF